MSEPPYEIVHPDGSETFIWEVIRERPGHYRVRWSETDAPAPRETVIRAATAAEAMGALIAYQERRHTAGHA